MHSNNRSASVARNAAVLTLCAVLGSAHAAAAPQDTTGAIENFDILGVKLGMTEAQAVTAMKNSFPKLTPTPMTVGANKHAGLRYNILPDPMNQNFNFVKVYFNEGRVWAVWRDDVRASYSYDETFPEMAAKYAGAAPIEGSFVNVVDNHEAGVAGRGPIGLELFKGNCSNQALTFNQEGPRDVIRLQGGCTRIFWLAYGVHMAGGKRIMGNGRAQLVDLDAGRVFLANKDRDTGPAPATAAAKL